jgi:hypothetical protein
MQSWQDCDACSLDKTMTHAVLTRLMHPTNHDCGRIIVYRVLALHKYKIILNKYCVLAIYSTSSCGMWDWYKFYNTSSCGKWDWYKFYSDKYNLLRLMGLVQVLLIKDLFLQEQVQSLLYKIVFYTEKIHCCSNPTVMVLI